MNDSQKSERSVGDTSPGTPPRQARSRATRRELVDAARAIFARDGFEQARLEDISAAAGKTRGAFYAHFTDKEDAFFAIFEEDLLQDRRRVRAALANTHSLEERLEALTALLALLMKNRRRMLLSIEFKLYAIRRPQHKRLAALHRAMKVRCAEAHIEELLPELQQQCPARKRETAAQFGALLDGLALNRLFDPQSLRDPQLLALLRSGTRTVLGLEAPAGSDALAAESSRAEPLPIKHFRGGALSAKLASPSSHPMRGKTRLLLSR